MATHQVFAQHVCRALTIGPARGVTLAVVGAPGCGKSTLLEPLARIFEAMPAPEVGSTFLLSAILDKDIVLWQDFEFCRRTVDWQDLLRLTVGETVGVRVPGAPNVDFVNKAPVFYSALQKIAWTIGPRATRAEKSQAMDERFTTMVFHTPVPLAERRSRVGPCPCCFARVMLEAGGVDGEAAQDLVYL